MPIVPLSPGQHLNADAHAPGGGRFRIEKPLSAGGFAITYLAHDQQFDDRCVIKELAIDQLMVRSGTEMVPLPGREADVAVWVQKVQKEAQTLHRLRNAGVVPIRATWRELGTAYFAMDFIDGIELPSEPTPGANWATWETVALKFLAALGAIHAEGLVHGDIKPQNVLVSREGNPVIIDFGTARSTEEAKKTRLTTVAMTPGYCPPELAVRDRAREMGPWSDLYSWALTVMGLVIRHRGIDGAPLDTSARVALAQHGLAEAGMGAETASALREVGVPEAWVTVLMACVALEPSARPQSAAAVLAGIQGAQAAPALPPVPQKVAAPEPAPVAAAPAPATELPVGPAGKSRKVVAASVLVFIAASIALFVASRPNPPAPVDSPAQAQSASPTPAAVPNPVKEPEVPPATAPAGSGSGEAAAPAAGSGAPVAAPEPDAQPVSRPAPSTASRGRLGVNRVDFDQLSGTVKVRTRGGLPYLTGKVSEGASWFSIQGTVHRIDARSFDLIGSFEGLPNDFPENSIGPIRTEGRFRFEARMGRRYFRMYQVNGVDCVCDDNCGNEFCYIDIAVKEFLN